MVEINNLTSFEIDEAYLRKIAEDVLRAEKACEACELSVAFVGLEKMQELNRDRRGKDSATDVLSFEYFKDPGMKGEMEIEPLGEVVICPSYVEEQAKQNENTFQKELSFVLIHGILHLLGYDHEKGEEEARAMEEKQSGYLCKYCK
ncbi:MAG: rRNA maturation RNase YbeY [Candidatus Paceibacterota bacterium]|jgi:probable rRNA maturation factor